MGIRPRSFFLHQFEYVEATEPAAFGELDDTTYKELPELVLQLNSISDVGPIDLFICSQGSEVDASMAIYDSSHSGFRRRFAPRGWAIALTWQQFCWCQ